MQGLYVQGQGTTSSQGYPPQQQQQGWGSQYAEPAAQYLEPTAQGYQGYGAYSQPGVQQQEPAADTQGYSGNYYDTSKQAGGQYGGGQYSRGQYNGDAGQYTVGQEDSQAQQSGGAGQVVQSPALAARSLPAAVLTRRPLEPIDDWE